MTENERWPEHEKLQQVTEKSQVIGEFIDYGGYTLCTHVEAGDNGEPMYVWKKGREFDREPGFNDYLKGRAEDNPEYESWGEGYVPVFKPIQQILADYFDIDLNKIEAEKRAMLEQLRSDNAPST